MNLYKIIFDGQPDYVEAQDFDDAIAVWKQGTTARGEWEDEVPDQPESVERMTNNWDYPEPWDHPEPAVMRRDSAPDVKLRKHAATALDLLERWRDGFGFNPGSNLSNDTSEVIVALSDALTNMTAPSAAREGPRCVKLALLARMLVDHWMATTAEDEAELEWVRGDARFGKLIWDLDQALGAKP